MLNFLFFFNDTAPTELYTLSLHDALPIWILRGTSLNEKSFEVVSVAHCPCDTNRCWLMRSNENRRSEEHTSELQSLRHLVCRLLLEKKKMNATHTTCVTEDVIH